MVRSKNGFFESKCKRYYITKMVNPTYLDFVKQTAKFAKRYDAVKEVQKKRERVENAVRIIQQQLKLNDKFKLKAD